MNSQLTKLSDFLIEREERIKHEAANKLRLKRIKKIDFSGTIHLDDQTVTKTDMVRVKSGNLVISGINAAKGAVGVYRGDEDVLATIHYSSYKFDPDRISIEFLKWFFKSAEFSDLLKAQVPGGIKTELKPKHILPLQVKIPKLSEQKIIADKLNRFERKQATLEAEITHQRSLLAKLKQAILQEAIQGKLTADWRAANPDVETDKPTPPSHPGRKNPSHCRKEIPQRKASPCNRSRRNSFPDSQNLAMVPICLSWNS